MRMNGNQFIAVVAFIVCACVWSASQLRENSLLSCSCAQPGIGALPVLDRAPPHPDYVFIGDINSTCGCQGEIGRAVVNVVLPTHDQLALQSLGISVGKQLAINQMTLANLDSEIKKLPLRFSKNLPVLDKSIQAVQHDSRRIWCAAQPCHDA